MKRKFLKLFVFFFLLWQSFAILASTLYVNITSSGGDGSSWAAAFSNLETALNSASMGDQIWVAQGTYIPSQGYNVMTGQPISSPGTETFKIPAGVQVYGGFNGTETSLSQRNFKTNLTILSGNLGAGNYAYHVVFFYRVGTTSTQLDGFTISDGMANGSQPNSLGAGIYNNGLGSGNVSNPIIKNCNLINNTALNGGAVYNNGSNSGNSSPSFIDCVFSNYISTSLGGAVFNNATTAGNSSPSFVNCLFATNQATNRGGAVYNNGIAGNNSPSFTNVTFYNNSSVLGSILFSFGNGNTTMTNAILWDTTTSSLISLTSGATISINYSDIIGGWPGTGNIDADPIFTNESNLIGPDLIWATNDDGLILQSSSPALAAGTSTDAPVTDIVGNPQTAPASMGCYTKVILPLPTAVTGSGTIGGAASFKIKAAYNSRGQIVADMFYNDPIARVHFDNPVVTSMIFSVNQVTLSGTVRVQNRIVTFTAILTGGSPGALSVRLSNGYFASGNLTSGGIIFQ